MRCRLTREGDRRHRALGARTALAVATAFLLLGAAVAHADPAFVLSASGAAPGDVVHFSIADTDGSATYSLEVGRARMWLPGESPRMRMSPASSRCRTSVARPARSRSRPRSARATRPCRGHARSGMSCRPHKRAQAPDPSRRPHLRRRQCGPRRRARPRRARGSAVALRIRRRRSDTRRRHPGRNRATPRPTIASAAASAHSARHRPAKRRLDAGVDPYGVR